MLYSVHIYIENSFAKDWYEWMLGVHIPDVMRTRCFVGTKFSELIEPAKAGYQGYIIQYNTTEERLAEYQSNFAATLQAEHTARYEGHFLAERFISKNLPEGI